MSDHDNQRVVFLNWFTSLSVARGARGFEPDVHSGKHLLEILQARARRGIAIEYFDVRDGVDQTTKEAIGVTSSSIAIRQIRFDLEESAIYAILLLEHVNKNASAFPVVDVSSRKGRLIKADPNERGSTAAHLVVQLPIDGNEDHGKYRCVIESVRALSRRDIEFLLSRQLRRVAEDEKWTFQVAVQDKKGRISEKSYSYHPKIQLLADVGRKGAAGLKELVSMRFTNRAEKQSVGKPSSVKHEDVIASVAMDISLKQAPEEPDERRSWVGKVREFYESRGYKTRLYFRHANGNKVGANLHPSIADAADLLMCPIDYITFAQPPEEWTDKISPEVVEAMTKILKKDALWQAAQ